MNKLILTGALSVALVLGVVGCGKSDTSNTTPPTTTKVQTNTTSSNPSGNPALTGANTTGSTGSTTVGSNTTAASGSNPLLQGNTAASGSGSVSSGSQPGVTTSQPLPGPSGADMQKVLTSVFQSPQVLQILADPSNAGKKPGFVFSQQNGNTVSVNGQWTGQLTLNDKPVANVAVSAQDFSVKSVTLIH